MHEAARRIVVAIVAVSLAVLPAGMAAQGDDVALPKWVGCHGEVAVTQTGERIEVVYDQTRVYQRFSYWVRSYGGAHAVRVDVIEISHTPIKEPAANAGLRDVDGLKGYMRSEYGNQATITGEDGVTKKQYVDVYVGSRGVMVEVLTFVPVKVAPVVEGDSPAKEATF